MNTACRALVTMARCGARAETLRKLPILSRLRSLFIANFARLMRPRLLFQPPGGGFYDYDSTCRFMHVWPAKLQAAAHTIEGRIAALNEPQIGKGRCKAHAEMDGIA